MSARWWLLFSVGLVLSALLLGSCGSADAGSSRDAGAPQEEWDGHCRGKRDAGRRAVWRGTVYVCKDNGPPNHWYFVQDPDFYGVRM